jgi:glycosyltransferase involved in cell wall biosynthesis
VEEFGLGGIARYAADVADLIHPAVGVRVATTDAGPAPGLAAPHEVWFPVGSGAPPAKARGALLGLRRAALRVRRGDAAWFPLGIRPGYEALLLRALRARGGKVVATVHNRVPHEAAGASDRIARLAAACDAVVVHTAELREWAERRGATVAADLPFPVPGVAHAGPAGVHDRASLGAGDRDLLLVLAGNLRAYKGVDVLLEAVAGLPADACVRVVLAGQVGGDDPMARARALGVADRVHLIGGYLPDGELVDVLTAADAVALPYRRIDHSGMAVLAAALGLPAVASDLRSLRAVYAEGAVYVPPADPAALTVALAGLPAALPRLRAALSDRTEVDPADAYRRLARALLS